MFKKLQILLLFFISNIVNSQNPTLIWEKSFIMPGLEESYFTAELKDSTFLSVGYSNSFSGSNSQIWIINFNKEGNLIWQKQLLVNGYSIPKDLISDNLGNIYLAIGSTAGYSHDKSDVSYGNYDFWIVKLDNLGNKIWDKTFGGNDFDLPESITIGSDNKIYVSGSTGSSISGNKSAQTYGNSDFWVLKLDHNGNKIWEKSYGGNGGDFCRDHTEINGILYLSGHSEISNNQSSFNYVGNSDLWILGINHDGSLVFERIIYGFGSDYSSCITDSKDGNLIIGARSGSTQGYDKSQNNFGYLDFWIIKLSLNGNIIWNQSYGGNDNDSIDDIIVDQHQNILAFGTTASSVSGNKSTILKGWQDYWIFKLNPAGAKLWERTYGSNSYEIARNIVISHDNHIYITGESAGKNSFDKSSIAMNRDPWILKIKDCPPVQDPISQVETVNLGRSISINNNSCLGTIHWYNSNFQEIKIGNPLISAPIFSQTRYLIKCKFEGCMNLNYIPVDVLTKCPDNYIFSIVDNPIGSYISKDFIKINSSIKSNTQFKTNGFISLDPGFTSEDGVVIITEINGCQN
ncbi:hypothetical protein [Lacihabitans soyangensis]|uniref:T9SS C-terminal target domain-containing protein n=1 Tax=Lacihabitans soyangensis TaxID=869394 RepID=A0AAE3KTH7_9BACT|nr:hypothetical protein [Lacihabitans soyangensis]MCP9764093.1 hypothetical protein [Lacihabitans soyangensis]